MLTSHLRKLEEEGIIECEQIYDRPVQIEYRLSEYGLTLKPILDEMRIWGENNNPNFNRAEAEKQKTFS